MVIWTDAAPERARRWWTVKPAVRDLSLSLAIAGATGVSGGAAHLIPALLLPEAIAGSTLTVARDPKLAGEETLDGVSCLKVEFRGIGERDSSAWLEKDTLLLRRLVEETTVQGSRVTTTTNYVPSLNPDLQASDFDFTPPSANDEP